MTHPTILICGNYGAGNFGDELILTGLLSALAEIESKEIIITSGNPQETAQTYEKYGVKAINFFPSSALGLLKSILTLRLFRSFYHLSRADLILFGGGCLFNEKEFDSINIWYSQFRWFRRLHKKLIVIGQSFGTLTNQESIRKIKEIATYAEKIFVRDGASKKIITSLIPSANEDREVLLDPALWLEKEDISKNIQSSREETRPYAIIILRDWISIEKNNLLTKVTSLTQYLFETYHLSSRIFILQKDSHSDEKISHELYEKIKPYTDAPPQTWSTIDDMAQQYQYADLILSMRLHGGILGLILEKPTMFLNYDDKVGNLLTDLNLEHLMIDPNIDQYESKADSLIASASNASSQTSYLASQKSSSKTIFNNYLTKIIISLK